MRIESPYHDGELQVQKRVGALSEGAQNARVIQDSIIKGALRFISQQPMAVLGSIDAEKNIWASMIVGQAGFMTAPNDQTVNFHLPSLGQNHLDPFWKNMASNHEVGMLVIDLSTRRRLRINGTMTSVSSEEMRLQVKESYPNCPKYIQRRYTTSLPDQPQPAATTATQGKKLGSGQEDLIRKADTFFVASAHPERGVDASHRGGQPGFVRVVDDSTLRIPDYEGNCMFNTLGNFVVNPRVGLVFPDFTSHRTLQLIGRPEIEWDSAYSTHESGGTRRFWDLHIDRWLEIDRAFPMEWSLLDYSPHNPSRDP